jgi:hypothetical protein
MTIEDRLAHVEDTAAAILRELRELRAERQHQGGRWGSRAQAAQHHGRGLDWIDARIADGSLRSRKLGPDPVARRDKLGRRIDRRRVQVWIDGPPGTREEIGRLAAEARR